MLVRVPEGSAMLLLSNAGKRRHMHRSRITPAPYEKAQASEEICKRAAHPSSKLNQKKCRGACACLCVSMPACMYVYVLEMNVRMQVSSQ